MAKEKNAIIVAFIAALLPMFYFPTGFIAVIIVGLVTLQRGHKAGFWVLTWVALPTIAMLILRRFGLFDLLLLRCILVWFLATVLTLSRKWSVVLGTLMLLCVIVVVMLQLLVPHLQEWWIQQLSPLMAQALPLYKAKLHLPSDITPADLAALYAPLATGLYVFFVAATALVELMIACYWQSLIVKPSKKS